MSNDKKIANHIKAHYGSNRFTTGQIYNSGNSLGMPKGSISGALNSLKNKGILVNDSPRMTANGHIMKVWQMVIDYPLR